MLAQITDRQFVQLRDVIRERFGIFYDDTKQFLLQSRLQTRLVKCSTADFGAYYLYLMTHPDRAQEWDELASVLSNNETYFFRERAQLDVLATQVVDDFVRAPDAPKFRVWSAACSSGEEPFSIAMRLREAGRPLPSLVEIKATDISPRVLEKCGVGFYRELSFRAIPPELISKYFRSTSSGGFLIADDIKRMVSFSRVNLLDEQAVAQCGPVDAIFCRNVLIYFDKPTQKRVVEAFAKALRPRGYLFLGHAESIMRLTDLYEPTILQNAIYYRKRA